MRTACCGACKRGAMVLQQSGPLGSSYQHTSRAGHHSSAMEQSYRSSGMTAATPRVVSEWREHAHNEVDRVQRCTMQHMAFARIQCVVKHPESHAKQAVDEVSAIISIVHTRVAHLLLCAENVARGAGSSMLCSAHSTRRPAAPRALVLQTHSAIPEGARRCGHGRSTAPPGCNHAFQALVRPWPWIARVDGGDVAEKLRAISQLSLSAFIFTP